MKVRFLIKFGLFVFLSLVSLFLLSNERLPTYAQCGGNYRFTGVTNGCGLRHVNNDNRAGYFCAGNSWKSLDIQPCNPELEGGVTRCKAYYNYTDCGSCECRHCAAHDPLISQARCANCQNKSNSVYCNGVGGGGGGDNGGEIPPPPPPPTPTPIPPSVTVTDIPNVTFFWNSKDVDKNIQKMPEFTITIQEATDPNLVLHVEVKSPAGIYHEYQFPANDPNYQFTLVGGNSKSFKFDEANIQAYEKAKNLCGGQMSACPISGVYCFGTTLGKCVPNGVRPSQAIGWWEAKVWVTASNGTSSPIDPIRWQVVSTIIHEN